MFCPQCKAEYRPGFTQCSDCDVALVERLSLVLNAEDCKEGAEEGGTPEASSDVQLRVVFRASDIFEANLIKSSLEANGIEVCTAYENRMAPVEGIEIAVPNSQESLALDVLSDYPDKAIESPTNTEGTPVSTFDETQVTEEKADSRNCGVEGSDAALDYDGPTERASFDGQSASAEDLRYKIYKPEDYGGFWRRYWANVVDGMVLSGAFGIVSAISPEIGEWFAILLVPLYQIGSKASRGTTFGYQRLGIKVISVTGSNPTVNQIAVRQISAIFSLIIFGLGYLWIAFDPKKQSWHDKIAGTYVIRTDAQSADTIVNSSRSSPIRAGTFACLLLIAFAAVGGLLFFWASHEDERQMATAYLQQNVAIKGEVGTLTELQYFIPFSLDRNTKTLNITASGEQGTIDVTVKLRKEGGIWMVTEGDYRHSHGTHVPLDVGEAEMDRTLYSLAESYRGEGKFAKAEPLYQRSITLKEKLVGPESPEVATALNDLGEAYEMQRKFRLAEPLYQRALTIYERAYGPADYNVASTLNNRALLYDKQHKYAEAEPLYQRSLSILDQMATEHPDLFIGVLKNYAGFLRDTNRTAEAAKLEARAQAVHKDQKTGR